LSVFDLAHDFGFNDTSLTSKNALLPVLYWVHHLGLAPDLTTKKALQADREVIRRWLHAVLLKGIFGASADTTLAAIRRAFVGDDFGAPYIRGDITNFPAAAIAAILQSQGKDPSISAEFIDALLDTRYEDKQAFSILALLAPHLDYRNGDFHKDHLHPASQFRTKGQLKKHGVVDGDLDFYRDERNWNSILNLRHLDSSENKSKQDKPLVDWVDAEAVRQHVPLAKFCVDRDLPEDRGALQFSRFHQFIEARRAVLHARLHEALA
jgi:hypothetical protein